MDAVVAVTVDGGEGLAAFVVDILGDIEGALMAFGAESTSIAMDFVGAGACGAVGSVTRKSFHDVKLIVAGKTRVCGDGSEIDLADEGRHDWLRVYELNWCIVIGVGIDVFVAGLILRRHLG